MEKIETITQQLVFRVLELTHNNKQNRNLKALLRNEIEKYWKETEFPKDDFYQLITDVLNSLTREMLRRVCTLENGKTYIYNERGSGAAVYEPGELDEALLRTNIHSTYRAIFPEKDIYGQTHYLEKSITYNLGDAEKALANATPEPQHDPEPQATLPPELDIPGAGIIFNRAIEAELMRQDGDKYKWLKAKALLVYMLEKIYCKDANDFPEQNLNKLFQEDRLGKARGQLYYNKGGNGRPSGKPKGYEIIDKLFREA